MRKLSYIHKGDTGSMSFATKQRSFTQGTFMLYGLGVAVFFLIALARLFQLTIVKGSYYSLLSEDNRVKELIIEAPRGIIYDRKGIELASSTQPDLTDSSDRVFSNRVYKYSDAISHIIGYRQSADATDFDNDTCINKLKFGDKVGKKGIEQFFECDLRGRHGKKLVEVDAHGAQLKTLSVLDPQKGDDLRLALDISLQEKATELLGDQKGAVVGLKPDTGEVLILASTPGYDPQIFEDRDTKSASELILDEDEPLFNRATEGTYPPGSTFKIFVATAGLEEGVITPDETIEDNGFIEAGPLKFH
ncbi:MAG: penicillin-binding transpeptidase domain-containing protein, partial [Candidatus Roizmanbacteria bacterium]|nr:penicillin-binding transpeptidase domain-containing protein [Candidatus Roizmanbacteria bacterium]